MTNKKGTAGEAIRRRIKHIRGEQAAGTSLNQIRRELEKQGMPKVRHAYFNEVVLECGELSGRPDAAATSCVDKNSAGHRVNPAACEQRPSKL